MKKVSITSIVTIFIMIFIMQSAIAVATPKPSVSTVPKISGIIEKLNAKGYKIIHEIEYNHKGTYKAEVLNKDGYKLKLTIDEKTGVITEPKEKTKHTTMLDVVKIVEAAGYKDIFKIQCDENKYEVGALDKDGKKVDLEVNAVTGDISKDWF